MNEEPRTTNDEPRPEAADPRVTRTVAHFFRDGSVEMLTPFEMAVAWARIGEKLIEASDFPIAQATCLANLMKGVEGFRKCAAGEWVPGDESRGAGQREEGEKRMGWRMSFLEGQVERLARLGDEMREALRPFSTEAATEWEDERRRMQLRAEGGAA
jgi:hypothetical protein